MYVSSRPDVSRETVNRDVSRETLERLNAFLGVLERWNSRINLVSAASRTEVWSRHVDDSLRLVPLIPNDTARAIDLGSGAGFPGLIVAIATGLHVDLIESDRRKAAFLAEAARVTEAPVRVYSTRIESCPCLPARLVLIRALAPLARLLELAHPMLARDGVCLFHKGRNVETEIAVARKDWTMVADYLPSDTDPGSIILRLRQVARV